MQAGWLELLGKLQGCAFRVDPGSFRGTFATDTAAALTGFTLERWLADPPLLPEMIHEADRPRVLAELRASAEGGGDRVIEHRVVAADGRTLFCRTVVRLETSGELVGLLLDVTGERRAEEKLQAEEQRARAAAAKAERKTALLVDELSVSLEELQRAQGALVKRERLAALGELASVIAHEVRNPLGAIFNSLGALRKMITLEGEAALLFQIIEEESSRLNRITVDLLDWVRPLQPMLQPQPLPPQIDQALRAAERAAQLAQSKVTVDLEVEAELPQVLLDDQLFHLALVNVLSNGIQAMPRGGRLRVDVRPVWRGEQSWVAVRVTDSGPGIPPEVIGRIFEPFFTTRASGTGLGLALVKRIVESHGGEIDVESAHGQGSTFTLRLRPAPEGV